MLSNIKSSDSNTSFAFKTNDQVMKKHCEDMLFTKRHEVGAMTGKKAQIWKKQPKKQAK